MPLGAVRSNWHFSLEDKRVLNGEVAVSDDDNIKQARAPLFWWGERRPGGEKRGGGGQSARRRARARFSRPRLAAPSTDPAQRHPPPNHTMAIRFVQDLSIDVYGRKDKADAAAAAAEATKAKAVAAEEEARAKEDELDALLSS